MEKNIHVPNHQPDTSDTAIKSPINSPSNGSVSKPIVPLFCSHQNSWVKMDVHPTKNGLFIGIDPYPNPKSP
jgi:hypothetical protein